jgi:predicted AAA+ superfamily ATPase
MRRCGKSVLLHLYYEELIRTGVPKENIIQMNFESFEYQGIKNKGMLNEFLSERIKTDDLHYVLLDEIQNVEGWELTLSGLVSMGNCDVYVTGSNSDMLSSELATRVSGRHVEIRVFPLSLSEFMEMHGYSDAEKAMLDYLEYGGLPGIDLSRGSRYLMDYLEGVYSTVVIKDVLRHVNVSDPAKVEAIARFLFFNIGNITNKASIAKETGLSESTVGMYMDAMEEAFLILQCNRYDAVGKKLLRTNSKYYVMDLGIRKAALDMAAGTDIGRLLENVVFVELLRRGYKVRVGSYRDSEVDFIASKDGGIEYYQVCQTLMTEGTKERETRSLMRPADNYPKTVLTLDRFGLGDDKGIAIRNVVDWLMGDPIL